jgi:hypothetical protein
MKMVKRKIVGKIVRKRERVNVKMRQRKKETKIK